MCNNAVITNDKLLGQPTEGALLFAAMKVNISKKTNNSMKEIT